MISPRFYAAILGSAWSIPPKADPVASAARLKVLATELAVPGLTHAALAPIADEIVSIGGNLQSMARTPAPWAAFAGADTSTGGNWHGVYGGDGYSIPADNSGTNPKLPAYATLNLSGTVPYTWAPNPNFTDTTQNVANTAVLATCWYSFSSMSFAVNITDGQAHDVTLFALDWDGRQWGLRNEQVQVIDTATGTVLDTRNLNSADPADAFHQNGVYLTWRVSGNVTLVVTNTGSSDAVVSGIFFGTPAPR